jgi:hypothetical protein
MGSLVAPSAIQLQGFLQRHHLVLNFGVAELTLDVVFGDVDLMDERRVVESLHAFRQVVTRPAPLLLGATVADDYVGVTFRTGNPVPDDLFVVDGYSLEFHVRGCRVTTETSPEGLTYRSVFEMTKVTGRGRDREVLALDDLGMAGRASEVFPATQLAQVLGVVKPHTLERDHAEALLDVTALSRTCRILDLRPGLLLVGSSQVLHHLVRGLNLPHGLCFDPRGVVAFDTWDHIVRGLQP